MSRRCISSWHWREGFRLITLSSWVEVVDHAWNPLSSYCRPICNLTTFICLKCWWTWISSLMYWRFILLLWFSTFSVEVRSAIDGVTTLVIYMFFAKNHLHILNLGWAVYHASKVLSKNIVAFFQFVNHGFYLWIRLLIIWTLWWFQSNNVFITIFFWFKSSIILLDDHASFLLCHYSGRNHYFFRRHDVVFGVQ